MNDMLTVIFKSCLLALAASFVIGVAIILIALIIYIVCGVTSSLIDTFKEVRARNRTKKLLNTFKKNR